MTFLRSMVSRYGRWIGAVLSLAAIVFFLIAFQNVTSLEEFMVFFAKHSSAILLCLAIYGLAHIPMIWAWIALVERAGMSASRLALARIFLVSQFGKYLPGNVGQFFGRAFMTSQINLPVKAIGGVMVLEVAGVLGSGALIAGLATLSVSEAFEWELVLLAVGLAGTGVILSLVWLKRLGAQLPAVTRGIGIAMLCYLVVFGLLATAHYWLLGRISGNWGVDLWWQVTGAVAIAWIGGFLVPGAPAGIGLREVGLITLLAGSYPPDALILAVAAFRLVSMSGDIIALLAGLMLPRGTGDTTPPSPGKLGLQAAGDSPRSGFPTDNARRS